MADLDTITLSELEEVSELLDTDTLLVERNGRVKRFTGEVGGVDTTLTISGRAADAKATGDAIGIERNRITNLATLSEGSTTGDAELQDIRVGADGTTYSNAGTAVREQISDLKEDLLTFTGNETYPYTLNKSVSYTSPLTQSSENNWASVIIPCQEGDTFSVKGYGGGSTVLWMFSDSNGTLLTKSEGGLHINNFVVITAPTGASYLSCNTKYTEINGETVKGVVIRNRVSLLEEKFGYLETSQNMYSNCADDWEQGDGNSASYISRMKKTFPVLDGYLFFVTDNSTIPETFTNNSQIAVRVYDSSNALLGTQSKYFTSIAFIDVKGQYPTGSYLRITVNSAVASVPVTPQIASSIKAYVGYKHIGSNITTLYDYDNYNIPQYARKVVDGGYLPDYWLDYLHNKAIDIAQIDEQIGGHGFSFAFVTDQHWYSNYQKSPMILKWLKEHTNVNRFVGGGDLLTNHNNIEVAMRWVRDWANKTNGLKIRNVRGNHDNNSVGVQSQYWIGDGRFYSAMIRPCENDVNIEDGHLYYYEKIEAQKVVVFYLDTGDMQNADLIDFDAQIAWMSSVVQTLDSDWSILVVQHIIFDGKDSGGNPVMYSLGIQTKNYLDTVTNCNVIGVIGGHTHYDYSVITENGYPMIVTTCDAASGQASDYTRTEGTTTEQVIDVFHFDTSNRKIYATRIGAGNDREWTY